jgi:hypothetical protein
MLELLRYVAIAVSVIWLARYIYNDVKAFDDAQEQMERNEKRRHKSGAMPVQDETDTELGIGA